MALKEFKNLPDTSTPINAENLNHNFKEAQGESGYMKTTLSAPQTLENETITTLNLIKDSSNTSNALSLEGNGIKIGKGVKQVLIIGRWSPATFAEFTKGIYIVLNNTVVSYNVSQFEGTIETISMMPVKEGDIIQLKAYQASGSAINVDNVIARTFLQVAII